MPNRTIKDSICTSDSVDKLTAEEERLFTRLIVNCDDYGRMEARPEIVRAKCFPLKVDQIKIDDVEKWLYRLADEHIGTIDLYINKGKVYLQFVNWEDHNTPRAVKSKYPDPTDSESEILKIECTCNQLKTIVDHQEFEIAHTYISKDRNNEDRKPKIEKTKADKSKFCGAEYVTLTEKEYQSLIEKYGLEKTKLYITELDNYKGANPKKRKYESDYRAILSWVIEKVDKKMNFKVVQFNGGSGKPKTYPNNDPISPGTLVIHAEDPGGNDTDLSGLRPDSGTG